VIIDVPTLDPTGEILEASRSAASIDEYWNTKTSSLLTAIGF
jgi:hypothetical protein